MKFIKGLVVGVLLLTILIILVLSYLGVVPVLSKYISKPVDLGVKADPTLVTAFETANAQTITNGKADLNVNLSSAEVTSIFGVWETRDKNFPLHNVQVRFNSDGTGEASGYLKVATAISLAKSLGYSDSDIEQGKKYVQYVAGDLPFYVKGEASVTNNVISLDPSTFQVGKISVPDSITNAASVAVTDMIQRRITQIGGANIQDANFKSGSLHLQGSVPSTINY